MSLDISELGRMVVAKRGLAGVRSAAKEIGISPATLSRIENGHVPDLATFAAICGWLGEDPGRFLGGTRADGDKTMVSVHLRKRSTTTPETANALGGMIIAAQQALRDREEI